MKATLTIVTMPVINPKPTGECNNFEITGNQMILEQLPKVVQRMRLGLAKLSDVEWVEHTVTGLVDQLQQSIQKSDLLEMTLCHSALKYEPPRRLDITGRDITLFPAKWQKSDAWVVPGVGNA